jgi:hypothetical protein
LRARATAVSEFLSHHATERQPDHVSLVNAESVEQVLEHSGVVAHPKTTAGNRGQARSRGIDGDRHALAELLLERSPELERRADPMDHQ